MENIQKGYEFYRGFQAIHPHIGNILTAEAVYITTDLISQIFENRRVNWKKLGYKAALGPAYALGLEGVMATGDLVGEYVSSRPFVKGTLGPNLFGNVLNAVFFANDTIGKRHDYSMVELAKEWASLLQDGGGRKGIGKYWDNVKNFWKTNVPNREFAYSVAVTLTAWNAFQWANYKYIEPEMTTATTLGATFIWLNFLSLWSSRGSKKKVCLEEHLK